MNSDIRQLLTAYVLGETDTGETARIEALLAEDTAAAAELRAERARLEGTIALVKDHAPADLALSDARRAELLSATDGGLLTPRPPAAGRVVSFVRRPAFAVAAGLLVVVGLGALFVVLQPGVLPQMEMGARVESSSADRAGPGSDAGHATGGEASELARRASGARPSARADEKRARASEESRGTLGLLGYDEGGARADEQLDDEIDRDQDMPDGSRPFVGAMFGAKDAADGAAKSAAGGGGADPVKELGEARGWVAPDRAAPEPSASKEAPGGGRTYPGPGSAVPPSSAGPDAASPGTASPGAQQGPGARPAGGDDARRGATELVDSEQDRAADSTAEFEPALEVIDHLRVLTEREGSGIAARRATVDEPEIRLETLSRGVLDVSLDELVDRARGESPATGQGDFFLGGWEDDAEQSVFERLGYRSDYDAMRAFERELLAEQGLAPNDEGLRRLLEGLGYLDADDTGPVDTPELLGVRWNLFGRRIMQARIDAELASTCRRPGESLRDLFFRHWGTRPYTKAADDPVSTFAADVDTSSYTLARKMLDSGILPTAAQIRPEEWINYFDAELPRPQEDDTFRIATDLVPNPFYPHRTGEPTWFLRVGLQGKEVEEYERSGLALTFVVDTSGSMGDGNRIELVRNAMRQLLTKLDGRDALAIVAFSNTAREVLPMTSATDRGRIEAAISLLGANGGTNVEAGLTEGYRLASEGFDSERENRVVLLSDGVGNIGETEQGALLDKVAGFRTNLIYLNTIGVGLENHNDTFLEQLANRGDGVSDYVDTPLEARRAFVENFTGAFQTIARDVKIQVAFDPSQVREYRLIGYENRAVADRAFRDDRVDGGEVGAGHSVVALYELRGVNLGYSESTPDYDLGSVSVRYKRPGNDEAAETAIEIADGISFTDAHWQFATAPVGLRKNVLVARTAEIFKRSHWAEGTSFDALAEGITAAADASNEEEFRAFAALFARQRAAFETLVRPASPTEAKLDELKHLRYELALEQETVGEPDLEKVAQLEARIAEVEEELRRLVLDGFTRVDAPPAEGAPGEDEER